MLDSPQAKVGCHCCSQVFDKRGLSAGCTPWSDANHVRIFTKREPFADVQIQEENKLAGSALEKWHSSASSFKRDVQRAGGAPGKNSWSTVLVSGCMPSERMILHLLCAKYAFSTSSQAPFVHFMAMAQIQNVESRLLFARKRSDRH